MVPSEAPKSIWRTGCALLYGLEVKGVNGEVEGDEDGDGGITGFTSKQPLYMRAQLPGLSLHTRNVTRSQGPDTLSLASAP